MVQQIWVIKPHSDVDEAHVYEHAIINELLGSFRVANLFGVIDFKLHPETFASFVLIHVDFLNSEVARTFKNFIESNHAPTPTSIKMAQQQVELEEERRLNSQDPTFRKLVDREWEYLQQDTATKLIGESKELTESRHSVKGVRFDVIFEISSEYFDEKELYKPAFSYLAACLQEAFQAELIRSGYAAYQEAQKTHFTKRLAYSKAGYRVREVRMDELSTARAACIKYIRESDFIERLSRYMVHAPEREDFGRLALGLERNEDIKLTAENVKAASSVSFLSKLLEATDFAFERDA